MTCPNCGYEPKKEPLFRDRFNQPVWNLDTMLAIIVLHDTRTDKGELVVTPNLELVIPMECNWDSSTDTVEMICRHYYGNNDYVKEEIIVCKLGAKMEHVINLNKSMGDMQREGHI